MTERAEGFWWVFFGDADTVAEVRSDEVLLPGVTLRLHIDNKGIRWGPYLGKEPCDGIDLLGLDHLQPSEALALVVERLIEAKAELAKLRDPEVLRRKIDEAFAAAAPRFVVPSEGKRRLAALLDPDGEGMFSDDPRLARAEREYSAPRSLPDGTVDLSTWAPLDPDVQLLRDLEGKISPDEMLKLRLALSR